MMVKVTCAILEQHERVLVTQRSQQMSQPLQWEFPGGKLEAAETAEAALVRELKEELQLDILPRQQLSPVHHQYGDVQIELIPFICSYEGGAIQLSEHRAYQWAALNELAMYNWCAADKPIVAEYLRLRNAAPQ
ncbi:(deoxy)nucleoside triphosphate pyrophosphohydrolase [Pontibacter sp. 172403-2]|uniref:(deoxy)nucleoside triphosphate pyrophosphohydrolase n=1 Tax=Pontibacter rufus TaxID=2791028 RepID=UPI0018AF7DAC|nr:(deoxy)nucleoside triphosphate pyrophosphohydrolase [Pontibacter sp. 172403-2]MBF9253564.1 (deoxy)nucleoside triphosphate pyrophosphohydrolase [Pontibacter sp. 172403-2]